jgi:hypothetical protein
MLYSWVKVKEKGKQRFDLSGKLPKRQSLVGVLYNPTYLGYKFWVS